MFYKIKMDQLEGGMNYISELFDLPKNINERYKQLKFNVVCEPLGIVFRPSEENLKSAYDFGLEFANKVLK